MPEPVRWRHRSPIVHWWKLWLTRRPRTFNDKVRYKMYRDRRRIVVTFADKAAVREHIATTVGGQYLPALLALHADPAQLRIADLPQRYVVKPTHGSGAVLVVRPDAPAEARLPQPPHSWTYRAVRPTAVDQDGLQQLCREWLDRRYGQGPNVEWAYGEVPHAILVEEYLAGADGDVPADYKLFVFNGRCRYIQVDAGRFTRHTQDFFTADWQHLTMSGGPPFAEPVPQRPNRLAEMIDVAQRLGAQTDFVRVDLYALPGRVVVGELTNYPAGGHSPFYPATFNEEFGRHWTVPRRYLDDAGGDVAGGGTRHGAAAARGGAGNVRANRVGGSA